MTCDLKSTECISCGRNSVTASLDLGMQPPSNRYTQAGTVDKQSHALTFGQCTSCALIQLVKPMPSEMMRSRYEWVTYNEPEDHLDQMVDRLIHVLRPLPNSRIIGLTYKDDSTLMRFNKRGFSNTYSLRIKEDLMIDEPFAGLESITDALTAEIISALDQKHGRADILIVRHALEHSYKPREILDAFAHLVKPDGCIVFEVPDSSGFLKHHEYNFIWEEHISYFTPTTLPRLLQGAGFECLLVKSFEYTLEDSIIALVRLGLANLPTTMPGNEELLLGTICESNFVRERAYWCRTLSELRRKGERIAIFGAGHLAAKFLNFFDLTPVVECVIDDNPNKIGLCMPGSALPILPSTILNDGKIDLCLLALNPASEAKVTATHHGYIAKGGKFRSIFSRSPIAFKNS